MIGNLWREWLVWWRRRSNVRFMVRTWGFSRARAEYLHDDMMRILRRQGEERLAEYMCSAAWVRKPQ